MSATVPGIELALLCQISQSGVRYHARNSSLLESRAEPWPGESPACMKWKWR
jgi:hypothetical protein